jgi:hypothetical protein
MPAFLRAQSGGLAFLGTVPKSAPTKHSGYIFPGVATALIHVLERSLRRCENAADVHVEHTIHLWSYRKISAELQRQAAW